MLGDLEIDWGGLGGLCDVSVQIGCEPWCSNGLSPTPRWKSVSRDLVTTLFQGEASRAGSDKPLSWTCLVSSAFNDHTVCAALEDREASGSVPEGGVGLGAAYRTALCHVFKFEQK